jgi:hypothetical protein
MKIAIYIQNKLYKIQDLGPETVRYNYGKIVSEVTHDRDAGLIADYNPMEHFKLSVVPVIQ